MSRVAALGVGAGARSELRAGLDASKFGPHPKGPKCLYIYIYVVEYSFYIRNYYYGLGKYPP